MKLLHKLFPFGHFLISLLFIGCGLALITFAALQLWQGIQPWGGLTRDQRLQTVLDSIAVLTVAVAALELGQTLLEEEVQREAQMSLPTRVRRFLSRFMIVLVVSLSIEALVAVFQFNRTHPEHLPYAALIGLMAAALLAAWGLFIWLNRSAEELEPHEHPNGANAPAEVAVGIPQRGDHNPGGLADGAADDLHDHQNPHNHPAIMEATQGPDGLRGPWCRFWHRYHFHPWAG